MGQLIKGVVLLKDRPLLLGFPLWVVLSLEDTVAQKTVPMFGCFGKIELE